MSELNEMVTIHLSVSREKLDTLRSYSEGSLGGVKPTAYIIAMFNMEVETVRKYMSGESKDAPRIVSGVKK